MAEIVELQGLRELVARLGMIPDEVRTHMEAAFDMGLQKVVRHAQTNHPPWPEMIYNPDGTWRYHNITTNLTNSIHARKKRVGDSIEGDVGALSEFAKGDAMEYASKIERDHPFMQPAFDAKKGEWLKLLEEAARAYLK